VRDFFGTLFYPFLLPAGALFGLALFFARGSFAAALLPAVALPLFWLVAAGGLFLGWRFNRSRLFLAMLCLVAAQVVLHRPQSVQEQQLVVALVALLWPLNLAFFACLAERGLFTPCGLLRLLLVFGQLGGGFWLCRQWPAETLHWLNAPWLQHPLLDRLPWGQAVVGAVGFGLLVLLYRFIRHPGVLESGFCWSLLTLIVGLSGPQAHWPLFFAFSGLILLLGLLESFHFMAFRDELTGLPGRRALNEALLKLGSRYSLAVVDIDFFKIFNDRYGHDVGDQVLRMVATRLAAVRGGGRAFRFGGEEFVLLFPGRTLPATLKVLEQLRQDIEDAEFSLRGRFRPRKKPAQPRKNSPARRKLRVTVSIGVAEREGELKSPMQVLEAADQALYRAKKRGRNQVCR
jgi:diguanylate cyclase (GGDEF)-like protein